MSPSPAEAYDAFERIGRYLNDLRTASQRPDLRRLMAGYRMLTQMEASVDPGFRDRIGERKQCIEEYVQEYIRSPVHIS